MNAHLVHKHGYVYRVRIGNMVFKLEDSRAQNDEIAKAVEARITPDVKQKLYAESYKEAAKELAVRAANSAKAVEEIIDVLTNNSLMPETWAGPTADNDHDTE